MQALNYVPKREIEVDDDFAILVPAAGHGSHLAFDVNETAVQQYPRVHFVVLADPEGSRFCVIETSPR